MKKIFALLFIAIALVACGGEDNKKAEQEDKNVTLTGILKNKSAKDLKGSHMLDTGAGKYTLLRSVEVNLSDKKYFGQKVEVEGSLNSEDGVFEVAEIRVMSKPVDDEEEKPEEKDYTNSKLGFSLTQPLGWELVEASDRVELSSEMGSLITIIKSPFSVPDIEAGVSELEVYMAENYPGIHDISELEKKIGAKSILAYQIPDDSFDDLYVTYRGGFVYEIQYSESPKETADSDFLDILDSFSLTGSASTSVKTDDSVDGGTTLVDVSSMKFSSFESQPFEFKGQYPASWYYSGEAGSGNAAYSYVFSKEEEGDADITLSIINQSTGEDGEINKGQNNGMVTLTVTVDGRDYVFSGDSSLENVMTLMAESIEKSI